MKVSIFGLGYVGAVTAACLARDGHEVIGVDVNPEKVALINAGETPIVEPQLDVLLAEGVAKGSIRAITESQKAVLESDVSLISVGTPPTEKGEPDLGYVYNVCKEIGTAIRRKQAPHAVVLRSTVPPGTLEYCTKLLQDAAGDVAVHTAFNPEFLREGSAIRDYDMPPYTIIGTEDAAAEAAVREMYAKVDAPVITVKPAVAEMVKYVANTWHAAKVSFANEIGRVSKAFGVDGREVMNLIVQDTKLNLSPIYMRPGFAYGGSCLPKDLGAMLYYARSKDVALPFLNSIPVTNNLQIELAVQEVLRFSTRRVAVFGLAFKAGTDDLRESPAVLLIKRLIGEGCEVKIYDKAVQEARLMGTNLAYIQRNLPHFEALLVGKPEQALADAEVIVLTYSTPEFREVLKDIPPGTKILDLAGVFTEPVKEMDYHGLAW